MNAFIISCFRQMQDVIIASILHHFFGNVFEVDVNKLSLNCIMYLPMED